MSRTAYPEAEWKKHLGDAVRKECECRGISIRQLADDCDVPYPTVQRIVSGLGCDINTLVKISVGTGLSIDEMLDPVRCQHEWPEYPLPIPGRRLYECVKCRNLGEEIVA